jgi:hypothetical protein
MSVSVSSPMVPTLLSSLLPSIARNLQPLLSHLSVFFSKLLIQCFQFFRIFHKGLAARLRRRTIHSLNNPFSQIRRILPLCFGIGT